MMAETVIRERVNQYPSNGLSRYHPLNPLPTSILEQTAATHAFLPNVDVGWRPHTIPVRCALSICTIESRERKIERR